MRHYTVMVVTETGSDEELGRRLLAAVPDDRCLTVVDCHI